MATTLTLFDTILSFGFIILASIISYCYQLDLTKTLWISAIRCIVQLSFIGLVLAWIFANENWYQTLAILSIMTLIASQAAMGRTKHPYKGLFFDTFMALMAGAVSVSIVVVVGILRLDWHIPQYIIPILGMILGNALTAISLTMNELINYLHDNQTKINALLALSASPKEVMATVIKSSIVNGMTPTLNSLMVVGLVSLPGMMTGQILSGSTPTQAVRYQIMILFAICASGLIACVVVSMLIVRRFFDNEWRLILPK